MFRTLQKHYALLLRLVALVGIVLRTRGLDTSLWQDEAWVANSVLSESLGGMFYYEPWLQTSPPLFLLLVRGLATAFGPTEWVLRLAPLICGVLACLAAAILIRRAFPRNPVIGVSLMTLIALSPTAIDYSFMLKQYSGELLTSVSLLLAIYWYSQFPSWRRFLLLAAVVLAGLTLAYGLIVLLPATAVATSPWFRRWWQDRAEFCSPRMAIARWWALWGAAAVVLAVEYTLLVAPNWSPLLDEFWRTPVEGGLYGYLVRAYSSVFVFLHHLPLPREILSYTGARIFALVGAVVTIPALVRRFRRVGLRRNSTELLVLVSVASMAVTIGSVLLHLYPLVIRTSLLLLPCVLLAVGFGIRTIHDELIKPLPGQARFAGAGAITAVSASLFFAGVDVRWDPMEKEAVRSAMLHLWEEAGDDDQVYVHATAVEGFKFYESLLGGGGPEPVLGNHGWPCCPRDVAPDEDETLLRQELTQAAKAPEDGRLWVLHSDPKPPPGFPVPEHPELVGEILEEAGCEEDHSRAFFRIRVRAFECSDASALQVD